MNLDIEKYLFVVTEEDNERILGNAFIAGGRLVTASHVVGWIGSGLLEDGDRQRGPFWFEDRRLKDLKARQDLVISKEEVGIPGFSVANRGLRRDEVGKMITFDGSDFVEMKVRGCFLDIDCCVSVIEVCDEEKFIKPGMSGSVVINSCGEAVGPLVGMFQGGKFGTVEHISK